MKVFDFYFEYFFADNRLKCQFQSSSNIVIRGSWYATKKFTSGQWPGQFYKKRLCLAPNWKDKKVIDFDLRKKNSGSSSCLES